MCQAAAAAAGGRIIRSAATPVAMVVTQLLKPASGRDDADNYIIGDVRDYDNVKKSTSSARHVRKRKL